jgi:hypothetical protein
MRQRMNEIRAWEAQHQRPDPEVFRREILPLLRTIPIRRIAREVGISLRYASLIRRGEYVPHPRWWEKLRVLGKGPNTRQADVRKASGGHRAKCYSSERRPTTFTLGG